MFMRTLGCSSAAFVAALSTSLVAGPPATVDIIAFEGQVPPGGDGSAITSISAPFTNSAGQSGFTGVLASGERFVWFNSGVTWLNGDAVDMTLTGTEGTMGISDGGGFIYSPNTDGEDSVYTHNGLLFRGTDPAPAFPGEFLTFNSRPTMKPDGTAWWIAGITDTQGGGTQGRVLYRCTDTAAPAGNTTSIVRTNDVFDGFTVGTVGVGFGYDASDDSNNAIVQIKMAAIGGVSTSDDDFIWVNGALIAREGSPVGDGTNWSAFRAPSINNAGEYVFAGNTAGGPSAESEYLALNGAIVMRRGDTVGGVTLPSNWAVRWASINNDGKVAFIWEGGSGSTLAGSLFVGDASDLLSSEAILSIGDEVDTTGDGIADAIVRDFNASATIGPGLDFSDHGWVYVEVEIEDIKTATEFEAVLRVPFGEACLGDLDGDGSVGFGDLIEMLNAWGRCEDLNDCPANLNGDGQVDIADLLILLNIWGPC